MSRATPLRSTPETIEAAAQVGLPAIFDAIRRRFEVPEAFPPEVLAAAERVAADPLDLPTDDLTDVPFLTIDPPGSMDLDQAMHLERDGDGYRVRYAIAHLPSFVEPGGPIDLEARRRGQTVYAPDIRTPLHPPVFSEGRASLLPGQITPAYVWDLRLDGNGEGVATSVRRSLIRSVDRLDYAGVQASLDAGAADERLQLLAEVGPLRLALERARGGAALPMPEQEIERTDEGFELRFRPQLPVEDWNAQISLMTGMAAAELMIEARIGILRTMPPPTDEAVARVRRQARALGVEWPETSGHGEFLQTLDRRDPRHLAVIDAAAVLFRGAGYTALDGEVPAEREHAGVAAPYAHVTAPLRRLVDRFGLVVAEAVSNGREVPGWAREALPTLPEIMAASDKRAKGVQRACTDAVEAAVLAHRVGQTFEASVVDRSEKGPSAIVQILEPAVVATAEGDVEPGDHVRVRLEAVDPAEGRLDLVVV